MRRAICLGPGCDARIYIGNFCSPECKERRDRAQEFRVALSKPCDGSDEPRTLNLSLSVVTREAEKHSSRCEVGNIYPAMGGQGARYFVIVAVRRNMAHAIGFDNDGQAVSTTSYGTSTFEGRRLLGRVKNLQSFLEAEWFEEN